MVLLPHEADNLDHALQLADERMYAHKHSRSSGAARAGARRAHAHHAGQAAIAARALQPTSPNSRSRVARRFGMTAEEVDEVARAAELHDVGKVGIPDAILDKPGPLDADEWEFMRQHTILGERILNAAAGAAPGRAARALDATSDGTAPATPTGSRAPRFPRGSRIVAVCDAYEAMTADRPYRRALTRGGRRHELRARAGTQFDPEVVDGFPRRARAARQAGTGRRGPSTRRCRSSRTVCARCSAVQLQPDLGVDRSADGLERQPVRPHHRAAEVRIGAAHAVL